MKPDIPNLCPREINRLAAMNTDAINRFHASLFGGPPPAGNPLLARRRIAYRLQAEHGGGLPETARQHAIAIARDLTHRARLSANLNRRSAGLPCAGEVTATVVTSHDSRIPIPGSVLVKEYRGRRLVVHVLDSGFEWEGRRFTSLSAVAYAVTETRWNGFDFFGLTK